MPYPWTVPASIRYNNPGAMYPGPSANAFGSFGYGVIGGGHKIAQFDDPESGAAAQFHLLRRNYSGLPLDQAITKWSGGNSSPAYIQSVSNSLGVAPDTPMRDVLGNPTSAMGLAKSMARFEAGRDYPLSDEQWASAYRRSAEAGDGGDMPVNARLTSGNTNMANGLLDMYGLTPGDVRGGQQGGLGSMSNSLIGLGMGLLQPYNAYRGESPWTNALQGYMVGSRSDQQARNDAMKLREAAYDRAFRQQEAQRAQSNADRSFGLQTQQFEQGMWQKVKDPETEQEYFYNPRSGQTMRPGGQAVAAPAAPAPFGGGVSYAGQGPLGVSPDAATGGATAMPSPPPAQRPTGGFNLPPELQGAPPSIRREFQKKSAEELAKRTVQQQSAQKAREEKAQMIDPVGEDLDRAIAQTQQYPGMVAGWFGSLMKGIPSSQANDVAKLIDTVRSSASMEALQKLKEQSPTGASGLGQVTQPEHKMLQAAIGSLEQSQTPEQFLYNLDRVRRIRQEIIHGPGTAGPAQFQVPAEQRPGAAATPRPGFISKGYVFKGGDPSDQNNWAPVR